MPRRLLIANLAAPGPLTSQVFDFGRFPGYPLVDLTTLTVPGLFFRDHDFALWFTTIPGATDDLFHQRTDVYGQFITTPTGELPANFYGQNIWPVCRRSPYQDPHIKARLTAAAHPNASVMMFSVLVDVK